MNPAETALAEVRILDFSRVLAGPFCTMMLADLGADVIKVENPAGGDDTRQWGPPWAGGDGDRLSAYFASVNRNKRSLALNLKTPQGRQVARALAAKSDVVVENFRPGHASKLGLGWEELRRINSRLVYCSISGFGQDGPYSDRPGYDFVVQAMSGLMSITGPAEGPPCKVGVAISDVTAGLFAAVCILAALWRREETGKGQHIDVSLLNSQLAALVNVASNYLVSGEAPRRYGNQHANIVPYQTFRAADGYFVLAVGNDAQFGRLCRLIGRAELGADERFASNPLRVLNREALIEILAPIMFERKVEDWVDELLEAGIPAGPINSIPSILGGDPHVEAQGLVREMTLPGGKPLRMMGPPARLSETPARCESPPPLLGQHNEEILEELNIDRSTLSEYHAQGVFGT